MCPIRAPSVAAHRSAWWSARFQQNVPSKLSLIHKWKRDFANTISASCISMVVFEGKLAAIKISTSKAFFVKSLSVRLSCFQIRATEVVFFNIKQMSSLEMKCSCLFLVPSTEIDLVFKQLLQLDVLEKHQGFKYFRKQLWLIKYWITYIDISN